MAELEMPLLRMFKEGGSMGTAQLNAAIFMGFDGIWAELRELESQGIVRACGDDRWELV